MRKVLGFVLVLCVCVALMSVAAFAAPTFVPATDGTYSVPYTEGGSGNYYALLVVEGVYDEEDTPVISEDTVLYIDQAKADTNGAVSFDGWIPKNENPATVYLGGLDLGGPVLLGYLGSSTFVVSGTVSTDSGTTYEATVTLTGADKTFTATSVNGAYAIDVPEGTYTFNVNVKNHLSYTDNDFAVSADVNGKDVIVKGGDINGDGSVQLKDLSDLLTEFGLSDVESDINGDGIANIKDLSILLSNYTFGAVIE